MVVACMMVAECVVNHESYDNKLESARKVNSYICKECGLSKSDLPMALQTKFDEFSKMDEKAQPKAESKKQPNLV